MPATATAPATARGLHAAVLAFGPAAEGEDLVFTAAPPAELVGVLRVLHTGVRALLVGRAWYGERSDRPGLTVLNPDCPIPTGVTLLCVEGDNHWDRIHPTARRDLPLLFERSGPYSVADPAATMLAKQASIR
jgi:hypothetical protein